MRKTILWITVICGIGAGVLWAVNRSGTRTAAAEPALASSEDAESMEGAAQPAAVTPLKPRRAGEASTAAKDTSLVNEAVERAVAVPGTFEQAVDALIAPNTTFERKQSLWKQLIDSGKLDLAVTELEQRAKANPTTPEIPAVLGQAYLQKAGTIKDIREQGILGMKADVTFEAALNLDAANWDARFWKTTAMSYWPPQLGKGTEVIEQCLQLIVQQETQPSQPHFAQTYVMLGEQYQKQGHEQYAQEIWKRGLTLFPSHDTLAAKIK